MYCGRSVKKRSVKVQEEEGKFALMFRKERKRNLRSTYNPRTEHLFCDVFYTPAVAVA